MSEWQVRGQVGGRARLHSNKHAKNMDTNFSRGHPPNAARRMCAASYNARAVVRNREGGHVCFGDLLEKVIVHFQTL